MPPAPSKPLYAIVSPDRYLRQQALADLLSQLGGGSEAMGVARYRGPEANLAEVLDEARTPSLLGGRRTVVVDDADEFISDHRQALERYCSDPADCSSLVLVCQTMPANTKLYKIIDKGGQIIGVAAPAARNIAGWISQRARGKHGTQMGTAAAQRLRDFCGDSPGVLDSELAKLATYVAGRSEITVADVEALCGQTREEKIFPVMDAILDGNAAEALRNWEQVLATDRAAAPKAVAGLAWSVRRFLQAKLDWESGAGIFELSRRLFTDERVLQRRLGDTGRDDLFDMQRDLLAVDVGIKTGGTTAETAIETFIVKHCSRRRSSPRARAG